jgi:hypothetical protein
MASDAFSREFDACCKLSYSCIVPVCGFSAATKQREAVLIMKQMENGSLSDVLVRVRQAIRHHSGHPQGLGLLLLELFVDLSLFI